MKKHWITLLYNQVELDVQYTLDNDEVWMIHNIRPVDSAVNIMPVMDDGVIEQIQIDINHVLVQYPEFMERGEH